MMEPKDWIERRDRDVRHVTSPCSSCPSSEHVNAAVNVLQRRISGRASRSKARGGEGVVSGRIVLRD